MFQKDRELRCCTLCCIWAPDVCMLFPESEDTDVIKYAGDLLQSIEIVFIWDQHPEKVFEDSAWRGETTAMKFIVPILPKQGAGHRLHPVLGAKNPDNGFRRSCRTSGRSKLHSDMVFSSHMTVGLWSSFLRPSQFSFYSSLFIHSKSSHSFHYTVLITGALIPSFRIAWAFLFLTFYSLLVRSLSLALPPPCCFASPRFPFEGHCVSFTTKESSGQLMYYNQINILRKASHFVHF